MVHAYYDGWDDKDEVARSFHENLPESVVILFAQYIIDGYDGNAFVLFYDTDDRKLYEVNGGHCSCYGLEGQWSPEEVVVAELLTRPMLAKHRGKIVVAIDEAGKL